MDFTKKRVESASYGQFKEQTGKVSKKEQIFHLANLVDGSNNLVLLQSTFEMIRGLCNADPEYTKIILSDKTLLGIKTDANGLNFAQMFGFSNPEGGMEIFDLAKTDRFYLDLLKGTDHREYSLGATIVSGVMARSRDEFMRSVLRGLREAKMSEHGQGLEMEINVPIGPIELKGRFLEKLKDSPVLQDILEMRYEDKNVAHMLAQDSFFGLALPGLIADRPFFRQIVGHESADGVKVAFRLIDGCPKADNFLGVLEKLPVDVCKDVLEYKKTSPNDTGQINLAGQLATHPHLIERVSGLLAKDKLLESVSQEEICIDGETMKLYELVISTIERMYKDKSNACSSNTVQ